LASRTANKIAVHVIGIYSNKSDINLERTT
jgi:hypothetical protein